MRYYLMDVDMKRVRRLPFMAAAASVDLFVWI